MLTRDSSGAPTPRRSVAPKRIWIDLDNTPHVPFFTPIIRELEHAGHSVTVTVRDAFQVRELADRHGLKYAVVGRHYGANKFLKVAGTLWRAAQLLPRVRRDRPDMSMSHGSRALVILSEILRVPTILLFDYEHAERLPFIKPAVGIAPAYINDPRLARGFRLGLRAYDGLKEDVYAASFRPDEAILAQMEAAEDQILVTIRPPATEAHYHNPEAESLFIGVVNYLATFSRVKMVILPRNPATQGAFIRQKWPALFESGKALIPRHAVDGLNLIWFSDLVVSGGGTMNREAAALGVPVYSIFRGTLGAVDRYLASCGRLILIEKLEDIRTKLHVAKRARQMAPSSTERPALRQILAATEELALALDRKRVRSLGASNHVTTSAS